jgi:small subunit ribosomal protein S20
LANTRSAKKRIRTNAKKALRNRAYRSRVKTMIKHAESAISTTSATTEEAVRAAQSTLARAANKGILHKNNVARRMSRLAAKLKAANAS